jgi:calcineurin-like phosphoesterase family protein
LDKNGNKFRGDIFSSVEHMNETMILNWNRVVKPQDKVYHLGDVYIGGTEEKVNNILARLNGKKRLIMGNHDKITSQYSPLVKHFEKIIMWWPFERYIFTHVPLGENQLIQRRGKKFNFHGHIHQNIQESENHGNLSVENINYTPVHFDELNRFEK